MGTSENDGSPAAVLVVDDDDGTPAAASLRMMSHRRGRLRGWSWIWQARHMDPASFSGEDLGDVEDENRNPSHQYIPRVFVG